MLLLSATITPPAKAHSIPAYVRSAESLKGDPTVMLCGRRATVEVFLTRESAGRSAFAPLDAFNTFNIEIKPTPKLISVKVSPGIVTKQYRLNGGGEMDATWSVDLNKPLLRVTYTFKATKQAPIQGQINTEIISNVGWIAKFAQRDDDESAENAGVLRFWDKQNPDQTLLVKFSEKATYDKLSANHWTVGLPLDIPKGTKKTFTFSLSADTGLANATTGIETKTIKGYKNTLKGTFSFRSPSQELNGLMEACSYVEMQNVRDLPFGAPFSQDGTKNKTMPVVTASPDYHGIFANDCIQTMIEMGLLGKPMYEASQNSIEAMLATGSMESLEWFTGDGKTWQFPAPLGNTPQVALGACWHLLWHGDKALAEKWYPQIQALLALNAKFDTDGDDLEDRPNTPYPEQPNPGSYNHEMLYVQCFWRQAFHRAAAVAEWLGKPEAAEYEQKAKRISASIEKVFGTDYGLAVWVDKDHKAHPHIGHEEIIAAAAGDVSDARSRLIVKTSTSAPIWTLDGPLRAEPGKGVAYGDHVWTFMRWKLVQAMFRLGEVDQALEIADRWAAQEREMMYQAPEAFPTVTGTTGKLYTWTAGRAMRAVIFGLTGLDLTGKGVTFNPQLPTTWTGYEVKDISVHGAQIDLVIRRGPAKMLFDGKPKTKAEIDYQELTKGKHKLEVWVPA